MMKRDNKTYRNWLCLLWLAVFTSCMDETFTASDVEGTFISIRGMAPHTGSVHSGTPEDYIIHTLRVLAFDKTTGDKVTNLFYNAHSGDIIRHPIDVGSYDFVFLPNRNTIGKSRNRRKSIEKRRIFGNGDPYFCGKSEE